MNEMDGLLLDSKAGPEDEKPSVPDSVLQNLLLKPEELAPQQVGSQPLTKFVVPEAGFCVKTWTDKKEKVFINICKSSQIPAPKDITDEQLDTLLQSGDASQYRVPISLGEPHTITDNSGRECQAYDVIISDKFFDTIQNRPKLKDFLLTIVLEGLEEKYKVLLSRECRIMKNRKFLGPLPEQTVRQKSKPFIVEMDDHKQSAKSSDRAQLSESADSAKPPHYTLAREPVEGEVPEYLVMEVQLPGMKSSRNLSLEVGEDRIVLKTRPNLFFLDIDLPFFVDGDGVGAQYNMESSTLTVTLPVTGKAPY